MGILDILSGLATAAGGAAQGEAIDQQTAVKNALAQAQLAEEQKRNAVLNAVGRASIDPTLQGQLEGARANAVVTPHINEAVGTAKGLAPIHTQEAVQTATQLAPIHTQEAVNTATAMTPVKVAETTALAGPQAQAAGQKAGAEAKATFPYQMQIAGEKVALTPMAQRAGAALPQLDTSLANLQKYTDVGLAGKVFGHSKLGPFLMSPEGQNAAQAYKEFATAYYMAKYGRSPSPQNINDLYDQIVPQGTETSNAATLQQKATRLQQMRDEVAQLARQPAGGGAAALGGFDDLQGRPPAAAPPE